MNVAKVNVNKQGVNSLSMGLPANTLSSLEEMQMKYDRLSAVVSPEAEAEMSGMTDMVEKYKTLKEIKVMLNKLKSMWKTEASERRRNKQLNSFMKLYQGRVEIEQIIADKMGVSFIDDNVETLTEVQKYDAEIASLEEKLAKEEISIPSGMSTREARFGALP